MESNRKIKQIKLTEEKQKVGDRIKQQIKSIHFKFSFVNDLQLTQFDGHSADL